MGRSLWVRPAVVMLATTLTGGTACSAARPTVNGARLHSRVVYQVEAGPRVPGAPGHAHVRDWLVSELTRLGARVELQRFTDTTLGRPLELTNVIARFAAAKPGGGRRRLLLCAHYDTRPWCDRDPDPARRGDPLPGANDGASGVAVLLEVAELLARRPAPCEIELAFFDGEDQGRADRPEEFSLGARGYAGRLTADRPSAGFLFDMVGDRDLGIYPEAHSAERAANLVDLVLEGARVVGARGFHPGPRHRVVDDHIPLLEAGLPVVDIIDFDYAAWHTHRDLPDLVSPESLAQVARVAVWLVYSSSLARKR